MHAPAYTLVPAVPLPPVSLALPSSSLHLALRAPYAVCLCPVCPSAPLSFPLPCPCCLSAGEMIACDHEGCDIEWFHLPCVDLVTAPKGKWYCPDCTKRMKQEKERKRRRSSKNRDDD